MSLTPDALVRAAAACFETGPCEGLGLAVSGGSDSMALLHMLAPEAQARGITLRAATVDHRLRPEARAEAAAVAAACAGLGVPHEILDWTGWDRRGNLQDAARRARRRLLADWAQRHGLGAVALGHTRDDQAETVLMRLARGSGVDGLAGMASRRQADGLTWLRPLLGLRRDDLRGWLMAQGVGWVEDPSNADPRFQRVRARAALDALVPVGIAAGGLADTADRMAMARAALEHLAATLSLQAVRLRAGAVEIDAVILRDAPEETRLRLVSAALRWIGACDYRPRLESLRDALGRAGEGRWRSLSGVLLAEKGGRLWLCREPGRVEAPVPAGAIWDRRWRICGADEGVTIGALDEPGLAQCPGWRDLGLPRAALLSSPAIWRDGMLIAAPCVVPDAAYRARIVAEFPYPTLPH
ncbi:MAG: tRNA(Ile)-lysidine synthase [Limimaricola cinnabarinus]|jgi:tRNA(Ile)-lysidine synthase|uniref:tRNA lysidine(34) synthetase TilS n=1 Tax=Limimaricola cinnabarinus TaxID=1125964 RepID=UPI0039E3A52A